MLVDPVGVPMADLKHLIGEMFGVSNSRELTSGQVGAVILAVKEMEKNNG